MSIAERPAEIIQRDGDWETTLTPVAFRASSRGQWRSYDEGNRPYSHDHSKFYTTRFSQGGSILYVESRRWLGIEYEGKCCRCGAYMIVLLPSDWKPTTVDAICGACLATGKEGWPQDGALPYLPQYQEHCGGRWEVAVDKQEMVYCHRCGLRQFGRARCLRCEALLNPPDAVALIRSLRTEMQHEFAAIRSELGTIRREPAPAASSTSGFMSLSELSAMLGMRPVSDSIPTLANAEKALIAAAMARSCGDRGNAAKILGISKTTMYRKAKELGLAGTGATR